MSSTSQVMYRKSVIAPVAVQGGVAQNKEVGKGQMVGTRTQTGIISNGPGQTVSVPPLVPATVVKKSYRVSLGSAGPTTLIAAAANSEDAWFQFVAIHGIQSTDSFAEIQEQTL